jgi:hypothetical protein
MGIAATPRAAAVIAALATSMLLIAGCSGSPSAGAAGSKPASVVIPAMQSAVDHARSVHMQGNVASGELNVRFNLSFAGSGVSGSMMVSGASFDLISLAGKTYIKIDSGFLSRAGIPDTVCAAICGKYVLLSSSDAKSITGSVSLAGLTHDLFGKIPRSARTSSAPFQPASYEGQSVLKFRADGYTLDVVATATHYPLAIIAPHGQYIRFADWNAVPALTPPPPGQVVSVKQLNQLSQPDD